jgi:hypothetical protein
VSVHLIHLSVGGTKIKSVRSHLTVNDLNKLAADGAVNAGPSPLPPVEDGAAVEVERVVSRGGTIALGGKVLLAAEILAGRQVGIRIEPDTLMFFDLDNRELLRVRLDEFPLQPRSESVVPQYRLGCNSRLGDGQPQRFVGGTGFDPCSGSGDPSSAPAPVTLLSGTNQGADGSQRDGQLGQVPRPCGLNRGQRGTQLRQSLRVLRLPAIR